MFLVLSIDIGAIRCLMNSRANAYDRGATRVVVARTHKKNPSSTFPRGDEDPFLIWTFLASSARLCISQSSDDGTCTQCTTSTRQHQPINTHTSATANGVNNCNGDQAITQFKQLKASITKLCTS